MTKHIVDRDLLARCRHRMYELKQEDLYQELRAIMRETPDEQIIPVPTALIQWAYEPDSEEVSHFQDGYDAARRWVKMQIDYAVKKEQGEKYEQGIS